MSRHQLILWLIVPTCFGLVSVGLGRPVDWDLMNYHYYNPYAFYEGRLGFDIAPAQLQSYFNPVIDLPFYAMARLLPARGVGFAQGFLHGLNFPLVFLLSWRLVQAQSTRNRTLIAAGTALMGCAAPAFAWELGRTSNDNLISLFVLGNLLALQAASRAMNDDAAQRAVGWLLMAGTLMGMAIGLKQTAAIFGLASGAALLVGLASWRSRLVGCGFYALAMAGGCALALGHWSWTLWVEFGNPLFPMFNDVFGSAAAQPEPFTGVRYSPEAIWDIVLWPFLFSLDMRRVGEHEGTDFRFALLYGLTLLSIADWLWRRRTKRSNHPMLFLRREGNAVLVFFAVSFIAWMTMFSLYRYMAALELLVPILFLVLIDRFGLPRQSQRIVTLVAALLIAAGMLYNAASNGGYRAFTGPRLPWTERYFEVDPSPFESPASSLVVMLGPAPNACFIPELPAEMRFVRPEGNLHLRPGDGLHDEITRVIGQHEGPIYIMFSDPPNRPFDPTPGSRRLGLAYDSERCFALDHNRRYTVIRFCAVSSL